MKIDGLQYISTYISYEEQQKLLEIVDQQIWLTDLKRRVQHYGYRYDYKARKVDPAMYLGALPEWSQSLCQRFESEGLILPDQIIVNEYEPGQGIADHVDCIPCFGDTILSLTLGSSCVMNFTQISDGQIIPILLEPGSLVIMQGKSRYEWKHGIPARKTDIFEGKTITRGRRVSLTFRKVIES